MAEKRNITIIRNPVSGQRSGEFVGQVTDLLKANGAKIEYLETAFAGHGEQLAAAIESENKTSLVVVAGGDGTIREVASGLFGSKIPIGLIPTGTANVLARELGYLEKGKPNIDKTVSILLSKENRKVYPFEVEQQNSTRLGLCWLGAGFDAEALTHVNPRWKKRIGRTAFVPAVIKALCKENRRGLIRWKMHGDPEQLDGICGWAIAANIPRYAGPFVLTNETSIDSEGLAFLTFDAKGIFARIFEQAMIAIRPMDQRGKTQILKGTQLTLGSADTPLQLDGDFAGFGPAKITPLLEGILFRGRVP